MPVNPSPSVVVALTLTESGGISKVLAIFSHIRLIKSASRGAWATMVESDYNPDPTAPPPYASFPEYGNAQVNINPITGSGINVSTFNTMVVSETSGTNSIPIGLVTVSGGSFIEINEDEPNRQPLKLIGILNVENSTIDGSIIELGTVDSNRFTNPLGYDDSSSGNTQADREHALLKRAIDFVEINNYIDDSLDVDVNDINALNAELEQLRSQEPAGMIAEGGKL